VNKIESLTGGIPALSNHQEAARKGGGDNNGNN